MVDDWVWEHRTVVSRNQQNPRQFEEINTKWNISIKLWQKTFARISCDEIYSYSTTHSRALKFIKILFEIQISLAFIYQKLN